MDGYLKGRRLVEYQSLGDFASGQNFIIHHLPHPWAGMKESIYLSIYLSSQVKSPLFMYRVKSNGPSTEPCGTPY